ncbi:hypothetical protein FB446DRAFT_386273 [Lentinula raphanica]|nr:hypothetical protein FB446DRAFT_386273 [Lentinula raphanica]
MVKIKTLAPGILLLLTSSLLQTSLIPSVLAVPVQYDRNHGQSEKEVGDRKLAAAVTGGSQSTTTASSPAGNDSFRSKSRRRRDAKRAKRAREKVSNELQTTSPPKSNELPTISPPEVRPKVEMQTSPNDVHEEFRDLIAAESRPTIVTLMQHSEDFFVNEMIGEIEAVFKYHDQHPDQLTKNNINIKPIHDKVLARINEWRMENKSRRDDDDNENDDVYIARLRVVWWWDWLVFGGQCMSVFEHLKVVLGGY